MATKSKRGETDSEDDVKEEPPRKKPKKASSPTSSTSNENSQPTNKVLPVHISFPPRPPGTLRLASWNVCGLAASQKKGFKSYIEAEDSDILVLSETKVNNEPVDPSLAARYPHRYWSTSDKKSYAGLAILCKQKPLSVDYKLPGHPDPSSVKGRIITLEFKTCYLIGTYVVNAGTGLKTLDAKREWNIHFEAYIRALDKNKPVIWTGDLNVAPTEMDLSNAKRNWNKTPGYTEVETTAFKHILTPPDNSDPSKFVDVWRNLHPNDRHFTYFSYRFNCRMKGIGWRLDMFVVSERMIDRVAMLDQCEIRSEIYGASDHCPIVMELEGDL